jgi:hypothetical protein
LAEIQSELEIKSRKLQDTAKVSGVDGWQKFLRTKEEQIEIEQKLKEVKIAAVLSVSRCIYPALGGYPKNCLCRLRRFRTQQ